MRYAQLRLTDEEFITVKKAALDAKMSLDDFLKSAIFEKMFLDLLTAEEHSVPPAKPQQGEST